METIPEEYRRIIRRLVEADPEVAQATCEIPHFPTILLNPGIDLPYCGCFVGTYAWMKECKHGEAAPIYYKAYVKIMERTGISIRDTSWLAAWCKTDERDEAVVEYALSLLEN